MILDVFSELQRPKPWGAQHERQVMLDAIEQAKLADAKGFGCWWTVEHHGAPEFSYSSAPELILTLLSQHTQRIRFGHSGVLAPFRINHPVRIAERAAWTDIASGGRLELGLARSGGTEWETFEIDPDTARDQLVEAFHMIPQMWMRDDFEWNGRFATIPRRNVVPKPLQKPHPPLWQTSTSPESFFLAGSMGVGVLGTTMLTSLTNLRALLEQYDRGIAQAKPVGAFVNEKRSIFTFTLCAETRKKAIESRAAEAVLWFINAAPTVFHVPRAVWIDAIRGEFFDTRPERTAALAEAEVHDALDFHDPVPVIALLNRQIAGEKIDPVEAFEVMESIESVVIGDVEACRKKMERYAEVGVDRLMCLMQMGGVAHETVLESLRIAGEELIPKLAR
ncbi:LLM class flavin-dependent oxidoreductase [Myxococcota bacterium]|nr:LLM class flavin-dependent oxidoreductase [Myxococcota bacterium]